MSLATFGERRVDLLGFLAVLITASALIATVVLLTVAPRAEPTMPTNGSATIASVWSIDSSDGGYVGEVQGCDSVGNCIAR
jgi:hypothetical protein